MHPTKTYMVRYIHKISPHPSDIAGPIELKTTDLTDRRTLGAALRAADVMGKNQRLHSFRIEHDRVVAFPASGIWHSFILTPLENLGTDEPGRPQQERGADTNYDEKE